MIRAIYILTLSFIATSWMSCEDVIEVETPSEEPRLIVDGLIRVDTTKASTMVRIKVSETRSFFETLPPAGLDQITLTGLDGGLAEILSEETPGSGTYSKLVDTQALIGEEIFLRIDYRGEIFVAYANFIPSVPIDSIVQGDGTIFGDDDVELILTYTDPPNRDDYYIYDFDFANYLIGEDTFYQGQQFSFSYFYEDGLDPGTEVEISILGADKDFYDYMALLIEQSEGGFGPFETPSVTVRGNVIKETTNINDGNFEPLDTSDNFALGYFAIVQEYKETFTIE